MNMGGLYTSDEVLKNLTDGKYSKDIVGYVIDVKMQHVGKKSESLLEFILSNGHIKIHCLIWGNNLIQKHLPDIVMNRIIQIEDGTVKSVHRQWSNRDLNHDLIIMNHTHLTVLGIHDQ